MSTMVVTTFMLSALYVSRLAMAVRAIVPRRIA